jgi:exodeoxyribonuclease V gamma subunit
MQFEGLVAGQADTTTARLLRARGWLPQGVAGELAARMARDEALPLWQASQSWLAAELLVPCEIIVESAGARLVARIDGLTNLGLWRVRHGSVRPVDRLRLWIDHLLLNIAAPASVPLRSVLIARNDELAFGPEPRAHEILIDLLAVYQEGKRQALPFYPKTAWAWLEQKDVRREWVGDAYNDKPGERDDPYIRLALRDRAEDPLGAEFQQLARRIYGPLRDATRVGDG